MKQKPSFTTCLLKWYQRHKRDLPWRTTKDPYKIWVSEIILQQTRIEQGSGYYHRFLERFPDIVALAEAEEQEVLKLWQGLGYYSRARNMHHAARQIVHSSGGTFPSTYKDLLLLKGIGNYTAAAIASISFNEPVAVADGNVLRFLGRYLGITLPLDKALGKRLIEKEAAKLIPPENPSDFNQALMEFGALYCVPRSPECGKCIFNKDCRAFEAGLVDRIPVKSSQVRITNRYFNYLIISFDIRNTKHILMRKRMGKDIWKGLYDFPCIETDKPAGLKVLFDSEEWSTIFKDTSVQSIKKAVTMKHKLSHQLIMARFYHVVVDSEPASGYIAIPLSNVKEYPVPRLIETALSKFAGASE